MLLLPISAKLNITFFIRLKKNETTMTSIPDFELTTVSGTVYVHKEGYVKITSEGGSPYTIKIWDMKTVDPKHPDFVTSEGRINWEHIRSLAPSAPVIGKHYYVSGKDDWRISSEVATVKITSLPE